MNGLVLGLLGSGEFEPWSEPVDRWVLERSRNPAGTVLVAPTAAAHEGDASFASWGAKGLEHYARLGVPAEILPLKTREDAFRDDVVARLDDAAVVYFSGGNPSRLCEVVRDTPFWTALVAAMAEGLPYAGCSAGVACLTETTYDSDAAGLDGIWAPGLGLVRDTLFGPHWDIVDTWVPGASAYIVESIRGGQTFLGLDEDTAIVGDGQRWRVVGRQRVHVLRDGTWTVYADGDAFALALPVGA